MSQSTTCVLFSLDCLNKDWEIDRSSQGHCVDNTLSCRHLLKSENAVMAKLVRVYIYVMPYLLFVLMQCGNLSHLIIKMPFGVQKRNQTQVKGEG